MHNVTKYIDRCLEIASSREPASFTILAYRSRCLSVLAHAAQLEPIPGDLIRSERYMVQKLLRVVPSTFSDSAIAHLHILGLPRICSTKTLSFSAKIRLALKTIPDTYMEALRILTNACSKFGTLRNLPSGSLDTVDWDTSPFVAHLHDAVNFAQQFSSVLRVSGEGEVGGGAVGSNFREVHEEFVECLLENIPVV